MSRGKGRGQEEPKKGPKTEGKGRGQTSGQNPGRARQDEGQSAEGEGAVGITTIIP